MDGYALAPLAGGFSGETFLAEAAGERTVVRIYADRGARRGPAAVEVDAAVLRLVRGLVPVPEVLEVRHPDPAAGSPGLLVTSFLPGERLDLVLPDASADRRARLGRTVGSVLARLAQMPMPRPGLFLDQDLRTGPLPAYDLVDWVRAHRDGTALERWPTETYDALLAVADRAQELLDDAQRSCLAHGDFNPKNLLVDPDGCEVTGVLDWEFSHSGSPYTDLGNLLRFERDPAFGDAVLDTYAGAVPDAPADLVGHARAADLWALVELAGRRGQNPVADRAHDLLHEIARTGDLHASAG